MFGRLSNYVKGAEADKEAAVLEMFEQRRVIYLVWIISNLQRHHLQGYMEQLDVKPTKHIFSGICKQFW